MFGLFFILCTSGQPECYRFEGYVYPDVINCNRDIAQQKLPSDYTCLPVDQVLRREGE